MARRLGHSLALCSSALRPWGLSQVQSVPVIPGALQSSLRGSLGKPALLRAAVVGSLQSPLAGCLRVCDGGTTRRHLGSPAPLTFPCRLTRPRPVDFAKLVFSALLRSPSSPRFFSLSLIPSLCTAICYFLGARWMVLYSKLSNVPWIPESGTKSVAYFRASALRPPAFSLLLGSAAHRRRAIESNGSPDPLHALS